MLTPPGFLADNLQLFEQAIDFQNLISHGPAKQYGQGHKKGQVVEHTGYGQQKQGKPDIPGKGPHVFPVNGKVIYTAQVKIYQIATDEQREKNGHGQHQHLGGQPQYFFHCCFI